MFAQTNQQRGDLLIKRTDIYRSLTSRDIHAIVRVNALRRRAQAGDHTRARTILRGLLQSGITPRAICPLIHGTNVPF